MFKSVFKVALICVTMTACAGTQRGCSSFNAENFGADWLVVQYDNTLQPKNCWKLPSTSISNEDKSDGIYWLDPHGGHLVHISGWYNRVQIAAGDWATAAASIGVDERVCGDGKYPAK